MPIRARSTVPTPTTRTTRSTFKPTATSFLVAAPLVDEDDTSEDEDVDFSFHSDSQTYSDDDENAVLDEEEVPKWLVERAKGVMFPCGRPPVPAAQPKEEAYLAMRSKQIEDEYQRAFEIARASVRVNLGNQSEDDGTEALSQPASRQPKTSEPKAAATLKVASQGPARSSSSASSSSSLEASKKVSSVVSEAQSDDDEEVLNDIKDMAIHDF